jgi:toxin ParE1/3/4
LKLEWTYLASEDREAIFGFIEANNPLAAVEIDEHIRTSIERLLRFPEMGRIGRVPGTRELVITSTPYIATYRIIQSSIRILRILHSAQLWPDRFFD